MLSTLPNVQHLWPHPPWPGQVPFFTQTARSAPRSPGQVVGFFLFILLNLTLFVRPADLVPELNFLPDYEFLIISCFAVSFQSVLAQLRKENLLSRPISVCVLCLIPAAILSHLLSPYHYFFIYGARMSAYLFFKIIVYYLLLVGLLDSPTQIRKFLFWLVGFILILAVVAMLHFYGAIYIPSIQVLQQQEIDEVTGLPSIYLRLQSLGVFSDPNDFCLVLVMGMAICLYFHQTSRLGVLANFWLVGMGILGYALSLTQSRGGFIAMLTGLLVLCHARFGALRTVLLGIVVVPLIFILFAGRQTTLASSEDTAQTRLQLWSEAIGYFREAPVFGIGGGDPDEYAELVSQAQVAHNSYLHCYAGMGFVGGTIFCGAFFLSIWYLQRLGSPRVIILDPTLRPMRPYILALVSAYAAGLMSLSRLTIVPTYMVLGLAASFIRLTPYYPPLPNMRLNRWLVARLVAVSLAFLIVTYLYVRLNVRWH